MSLPGRDFLQEIDKNTKLILWVSDESLNLKTPGIKECNYLCDGLINDYLKNSGTDDVIQSVFHSQSFGDRILIAFFKNSKSTLSDIDDVMGLVVKNEEIEKPKIILIQALSKGQDDGKDFLAELIRRYRQFKIVSYTF